MTKTPNYGCVYTRVPYGPIARNHPSSYLYADSIEAAQEACNVESAKGGGRFEIYFDEISDITWRRREHMRLENHYTKISPRIEHRLKQTGDSCGRIHFLHISEDGISVAYTPDHKHGVLDRQIKTTLARYITKFYSEHFRPEQIRDLAALQNGETYELTIGETREDFRKAFENQMLKSPSSGFRSCMSYATSHYSVDDICHPAEIYAGGDLKIAMVLDPTDSNVVLSRVVIYPEKKRYTKIYSAFSAMEQIVHEKLREMDYEHSTDLTGAKLLKVEIDSNTFVMPYIDGMDRVADCGEYFRISSRGDYAADSTNGTMEIVAKSLCQNCEDEMDDDDSRMVRVGRHSYENWCEHCTSHEAFMCEETEEYCADSEYTQIEVVYNSRGYTRTVCAELSDGDYFHCENNDTYYANNIFTEIEVYVGLSQIENWCAEKSDGDYFECENSGEYYSHNAFNTIEVETDNGTQIWADTGNQDEHFFCEHTQKNYFVGDFTAIQVRYSDGISLTWCKEETADDERFFCEYMNMWLTIDQQAPDANEIAKNVAALDSLIYLMAA